MLGHVQGFQPPPPNGMQYGRGMMGKSPCDFSTPHFPVSGLVPLQDSLQTRLAEPCTPTSAVHAQGFQPPPPNGVQYGRGMMGQPPRGFPPPQGFLEGATQTCFESNPAA